MYLSQYSKKKFSINTLFAACAALLLVDSSSATEGPAFPLPNHIEQTTIKNHPVKQVVDWGRLLFETEYNSLDGVGSNLLLDPDVSMRFTRYPRMDLPGFAGNPVRVTGPNSQSCITCHSLPYPAGAGDVEDTQIRDPHRSGDPTKYIQRNPVSLFGSGALQLLAEQNTRELVAIRMQTKAAAASSGSPVTATLITSNNINYGSITAYPSGDVDTSGITGIDTDLISRPYLWKGAFVSFLRPLVAVGMDMELGIQGAEVVGPLDLDFDGVTNELSTGDATAETAYVASLPRPVTELELSYYLGGKYTLSKAERKSIKYGQKIFDQIGCASCHTPVLKLRDPVFREPSANPEHRYQILFSGQDPLDVGLDPNNPLEINLAVNPQVGAHKNDPWCLYRLRHSRDCFRQYESTNDGSILVRLYGDLKRHDMGPGLAEAVDELGTGESFWKTRELWGVGNTGPWLHDGRATTLNEAIMWHGGEAQQSRDTYGQLSQADKNHVIRFLKNLIHYMPQDNRYSHVEKEM